MNAVFADTYFYLALLNPRDAGHQAAKVHARSFTGAIVTSHWVLVEVADAFSREADREKFSRLIASLESNDHHTVIEADGESFRSGVELFSSRPDKSWSLTDCLSFVLMEKLGLREAFTEDHHFEQAGFIALLQDS